MSKKIATDEYKALKAEVSRMSSMANKRLVRLEQNELTELPAYSTWVKHGSIKFSVKGKDYNELQSEFWRLKNFLDDKTSTVRSANKYLKEMAENTGIKYNGLKDLKIKAKQFFALAEKIREYYKSAGEMAKALNYERIWEQINTSVKQSVIDLTGLESTEEQIQKFIDALNKVEQVENNEEGFLVGDEYDFIKL